MYVTYQHNTFSFCHFSSLFALPPPLLPFSFLFTFLTLFLPSHVLQESKLRKNLHNKLLEIHGNIRVICRVRPVSETEKRMGDDIDITDITSEVWTTLYWSLFCILFSFSPFFISASYIFSHSSLDHILSCPYYYTIKLVMTRLSCDNLSRLFLISTHSSHHFSSHPTLLSSSPLPLHLLVPFLSCPLFSLHILSFLISIIFSFFSSPILFS